MSIVTWPDELPSFSLTSWSWKRGASIIESEMELGPPKRRRRSTASPDSVSGVLHLTASQIDVFRNFVDNDLGGGVLPFVWHDFVAGANRTARIKLQKDSAYTIKQTGKTDYHIQMTLELDP